MDPIFGYPNIMRFSWATCVNRLLKHATTVNWYIYKLIAQLIFAFRPTEDDNTVITSFFTSTAKPASKAKPAQATAVDSDEDALSNASDDANDDEDEVAEPMETKD
ncbi:hypothetical protein HK101_011756 [Irineochytrium annulatum]|nr:hypothetical protein HK101_011756 [Irineochytrium annulatum]